MFQPIIPPALAGVDDKKIYIYILDPICEIAYFVK